MTAEPSPRPWRITHPGEIEDANGNLLYNLRDCIGGGVDEANAALIVDAVNEHDRLRDIVRRLADKLEAHRGIFTASGVWSETGCHETCSLIQEARAALVEGEKA